MRRRGSNSVTGRHKAWNSIKRVTYKIKRKGKREREIGRGKKEWDRKPVASSAGNGTMEERTNLLANGNISTS